MAAVAAAVTATIERTVEGLGYELVDAERLGGGLLRVTIDQAGGIGVGDCERVSRQLTHVLAVDAVDYARLEVSSPGLDRPLKTARDFRRFAGARVHVQLHAPLAAAGGRKRLQGRLLEADEVQGATRLRLQLDALEDKPAAAARGARAGRRARAAEAPGAVVEFALAEVDKARLVPELNFRGGGKESSG